MLRLLTVFVLLGGCALNRAPITGEPPVDAGDPGLDAPAPDVPGLDAPPIDAPADVSMRDDVPSIDAPLDGGSCAANDTTCDRVDDDCDGTVDDSGACSTSGACVAFTVSGIAYQSCPAVSGMAAWAGACRRIGPGYDLAVFPTTTDQDMVRARLTTLAIGDPHWIGLNDFAQSGVYVWRDRAARFLPAPGVDPAKRCVMFRPDGSYEELQCDQDQRILCSAPLTDRRCGGAEEGASCNGIDEDCDGDVDEGIDCGGNACTSFTFWDRVYYECRDDFSAGGAAVECDTDMGAQLSSLEHDTERLFLLSVLAGNPWVALDQADGRTLVTEGWHWPDSGNLYATVPSSPPWASGEPNDSDGTESDRENCAILSRGPGGFDDRRCTDTEDFLCERGWTY